MQQGSSIVKDTVLLCESDQKQYSLWCFRSSLGYGEDVQKTGMCIFIPAGDVHSGFYLAALFLLLQAGLFWVVCCEKLLTNNLRYEAARVGG